MAKFRLLHQLLYERGLIHERQIHQPLSISRKDLERVHTRDYHQAFCQGTLTREQQRRIGLPATKPLVQRAPGSLWEERCSPPV